MDKANKGYSQKVGQDGSRFAGNRKIQKGSNDTDDLTVNKGVKWFLCREADEGNGNKHVGR